MKKNVLKKVIFDIFGRFPMSDCLQRHIADFGVLAVFWPYGSATNFGFKSAENCQFFIFRKNKPKLTSYFKMSKKTHSWPDLSSFEDPAPKTALLSIYQLNVLERSKLPPFPSTQWTGVGVKLW